MTHIVSQDLAAHMYSQDQIESHRLHNDALLSRPDITSSIASIRASIAQTNADLDAAVVAAGSSLVGHATGFSPSLLADIASTVAANSALEASISSDLPVRVNALALTFYQAYQTEASQLQVAKTAYLGSIDTVIQGNLNGLIADQTDRGQLITEDSRYMYSVGVSISSSVKSFVDGEVSRATVDAAALSSTISATQTSVVDNLSTSVSKEISRATVAQTAAANTIVFKIATRTGSTDFQAWYADCEC